MPYYIKLKAGTENGPIVGAKGPYKTQAGALKAAQKIADQYRGKPYAVTVETAKTNPCGKRRKKTKTKSPARRNPVGKSQVKLAGLTFTKSVFEGHVTYIKRYTRTHNGREVHDWYRIAPYRGDWRLDYLGTMGRIWEALTSVSYKTPTQAAKALKERRPDHLAQLKKSWHINPRRKNTAARTMQIKLPLTAPVAHTGTPWAIKNPEGMSWRAFVADRMPKYRAMGKTFNQAIRQISADWRAVRGK